MRTLGKATLVLLAIVFVTGAFLSACGGPAPAPAPAPSPVPSPKPAPAPAPTATGTAEVRATDAPPAGVTKIMVTVNNVQVHNATDPDDKWITLVDKEQTFDLVAIQNAEILLGKKDIPAGKYTQIRFDVAKCMVTFRDKDINADLPSDKLKVVQPWEIKAGQKTILTLDFDAERFVKVSALGTAKIEAVMKLDVTQGDRPLKVAPKPSPTPTPTPGATPAGELTLEIVSILSPTYPGGPMRVEVKTTPGAKVSLFHTLPKTGTISIYPADKNDKPADANGKVVWEWNITERANFGDGNMEITAVLGDQRVKKTAKYTIQAKK